MKPHFIFDRLDITFEFLGFYPDLSVAQIEGTNKLTCDRSYLKTDELKRYMVVSADSLYKIKAACVEALDHIPEPLS